MQQQQQQRRGHGRARNGESPLVSSSRPLSLSSLAPSLQGEPQRLWSQTFNTKKKGRIRTVVGWC